VKTILPLIIFSVAVSEAAAQVVPLPRPRPAPAIPLQDTSACQLRLTPDLAIAAPLQTLEGPGGCAVNDAVRLEAVVMPDGSHISLAPPATLRCSMAEAIVHWVREDVAAAVLALGAALRSVDNYASYHCRGRNNIVGAQLSEHGRANALDIRSVRLGDGRRIGLTDPQVARDFRERLRRDACQRFSTVLGPGSDGYHEDHIHVDLQERARGRFAMCQWQVREPVEPMEAGEIAKIPLPQPRPKFEAAVGRRL